MSFIFYKLAPTPGNKNNLQHSLKFFSLFQSKNTVSEVLKTWYFPNSAFCLAGQWVGSPRHPSYVIVFDRSHPKNALYNKFFNLIYKIQINKIKCPFVFTASKIAFIKFSPT